MDLIDNNSDSEWGFNALLQIDKTILKNYKGIQKYPLYS